MKRKPICPRCGGLIPNDAQPGKYPGAISRWDNSTEVCSSCGTDEAMAQWHATMGHVMVREDERDPYRRATPAEVVHPVTGTVQWVTIPKGAQ